MGLTQGEPMNGTECFNALEIALENEMREREFYLNHADRTKNQVGKAMFIQIANEELEHYKQLMQLHEKWRKAEKWPATVALKVNDTRIKEYFVELIQKAGAEPVSDEDDLEAIEKAITFEAQGVELYNRLRDSVDGEKEKAFFDLLAGIEHEHQLSLKKTKEFLMNPSLWMIKKII
jgi:rubrerythrin